MMKIDYSQQGQQLQAILQDKAEELGQEMGLVQRESKLGAMQLVVTLVLGWLQNPSASLNQLAQISGRLGVEISAAGIHQRQRLPLRLIAQRLPQSVAAERRRKAKRKAKHDGQTLSAAYLALLDWSLYLTNTTPEQLTETQVITTYRIRWQVELVFKLWKSNAQLDHIRQWRTERVLAHLYARLLGLIIFHWLTAPVRPIHRLDLSFVKAFQVFQSHVFDWLTAIALGWQRLTQHLDKFASDLRRFACKNKRRKQPSTWQQLACLPLA